MGLILGAIALLSLMIWIGLVCWRGQFWRCDQRLDLVAFDQTALDQISQGSLRPYPAVCAIIPARDEAELLPTALKSLLQQTYAGQFSIVVVNDNSTDGTGEIAENLAQSQEYLHPLTVIHSTALPPGWSGKLWAIHQGIEFVQQSGQLSVQPDYFLLTDADINHHPENLLQLVTKAESEHLNLVSLMVLLRCQSIWEKLLIPTFVFFFQKLYPFPWVNHPQTKTAAAAGGCILIRRQTLAEIGGISSVKHALIDDCALAQAVKSRAQVSGIYLGLTQLTGSLRPYRDLQSIWDMVARTAFTQLNYSGLLLLGTLIAMGVVYLVPPISFLGGILTKNWTISLVSGLAWGLMSFAYWPTLKLYRCSPLLSCSLPLIALLYSLMTLDSAWRYWQGKGGSWKGRTYESSKT